MKDIKIVLVDLDGTLLNKECKVTDYTLHVIKKLKEKNIIFGVASGRDLYLIKDELDEDIYKQFDVIIGENGYHVHDFIRNIDIFSDPLSKEAMKDIYEYTKRFRFVSIYYENNATRVYRYENEPYDIFLQNEPILVDKEEFLNAVTGKVCGNYDRNFNEIHEYFKNNNTFKDYYVMQSASDAVEFQSYSTSKSKGLNRYLDSLHLTKDNVLFFGDGKNDIDMMQHVGYSVAMLNATDEVKDIANDITEYDNDHNGVAKYLEKLFTIV